MLEADQQSLGHPPSDDRPEARLDRYHPDQRFRRDRPCGDRRSGRALPSLRARSAAAGEGVIRSSARAPGSASRTCCGATAQPCDRKRGGHIDFAPLDSLEDMIRARLRKQYRRVSVERVGQRIRAREHLQGTGRHRRPRRQNRGQRALWTAALEGRDHTCRRRRSIASA